MFRPSNCTGVNYVLEQCDGMGAAPTSRTRPNVSHGPPCRGKMRLVVAAVVLLAAAALAEDEAEGEDGAVFEDETIYRAVIESCSG